MPYSDPKLVSDLLTDVKLALFWDADTDGNAPYTDAEIVRVAQQILDDELYPAIVKARESYLTATLDIPLVSPADYDETPTYSLPTEGMAQLVSVTLLHNGNESDPLEEYEETEWQRHGRYYYGQDAFILRGGRIELARHPTDVTNRYIRVRFVAKPMRLSADSADEYRRIVFGPQVSSTYVEYGLGGAVPTGWITSPSANVDLIILSAAPPHTPVEYLDTNGQGAAETSSNIFLTITDVWPNSTGALPTKARLGDFIIADFKSPIIQLPVEAYKLLRAGVVAEFADATGDQDKFKRNRTMFEEGLAALPSKLRPRNEDGRTYVNWNSPGRVRRGGLRWR